MKREWPSDWSERVRGKECPMCAEGRPDVAHANSRIFEGRVSDAYLVRIDVGQPGYSIVIWRGRHVSDPTELSKEEASAYFDEVLRVGRAIERHYRPIKMNFEMLGNSPNARRSGSAQRAEDPRADIHTRPRGTSRIATRRGPPARARHAYSAR